MIRTPDLRVLARRRSMVAAVMLGAALTALGPEAAQAATSPDPQVVADISRRSPNVIYELAFAHALGTPTLLVDAAPRPGEPRRPIFYLAQDRTDDVRDVNVTVKEKPKCPSPA